MLSIIAEFLNGEMFDVSKNLYRHGLPNSWIWQLDLGPSFKLYQIAVEKVQYQATRLLKLCTPKSCLSRMPFTFSYLKLPSLQYRHLREDKIFMYQIFHHLINVNSSLLFSSPHLSSTREHNYKVYKPHTRCTVASNHQVYS